MGAIQVYMLPLVVTSILFHHPETDEGFVSIRPEGETVSVRTRWPFDRHTDDWIEVENRFSRIAWEKCLRALFASGCGTVDGLTGGFLRLERRGADDLWLDLCDSRRWRPPQLSLTLPNGLRELAACE